LIAAEKLQRQFAESIVVNINELNGKTDYKVIVGAYPNINDAKSLHKEMKRAGIDGFVKNLKGFA
jgi:cell division protein FtsN